MSSFIEEIVEYVKDATTPAQREAADELVEKARIVNEYKRVFTHQERLNFRKFREAEEAYTCALKAYAAVRPVPARTKRVARRCVEPFALKSNQ